MDLQKLIDSIKNQEISWKDLGFDILMEKKLPDPPFQNNGFLATDTVQAIIEPQAIHTDQLSVVSSDKIQDGVSNLIHLTGLSTISSGMVNNNSGVGLTSTITDSIDPTRIILGICECTAYKNSVANTNQVPYGSDTIANNHKMYTAYDLYKNQISGADGQGLSYFHHVQNNSGSGDTYTFQLRWRYIGKPGVV